MRVIFRQTGEMLFGTHHHGKPGDYMWTDDIPNDLNPVWRFYSLSVRRWHIVPTSSVPNEFRTKLLLIKD